MTEQQDQYEQPDVHGRDAVDEGEDMPRNPLADLRLGRPPFWMIALFLILVVASWVPLVVAARRRVSTSEAPQIHLIQDMDAQPRYRGQQPSPVFADGRSERPAVLGTVPRGGLTEDDHYFRGYAGAAPQVTFLKGYPQQVKLTEPLLRRGQMQYNIYCAPCHGQDGYGNGPVNARAIELQESKWVQAASLHADPIRARPEGHLYNTITNGIRNMAGYGSQISVDDRWAVVAYVRALQVSQDQPANSVPPERLTAQAQPQEPKP